MDRKIVGKGENAGNQHFLLFPQCFLKGSFFRVIKELAMCGKELNSIHEHLCIHTFVDKKKNSKQITGFSCMIPAKFRPEPALPIV